MEVDKKIIICTTFRDFNGTQNDEIQHLFLKSLASQKYKNFELLVTLFGEKKVESEIEKYKFASLFYYGARGDFRYSLTQVLVNATNYAEKKKYENYIVLWTTCDVIFGENFFDCVIENYQKNMIGTSHPHITYSSINAYKNNSKPIVGRLYYGFDLIYFDKCFLQNKKVKKSLKKYYYYDWGIFEHFLISLAEFSQNAFMINLYEKEKILKIENDRNLTNEPNKFLVDSHKRNRVTFVNFLNSNTISINYLNLVFCHLKFKNVKNYFLHYFNFKTDVWGLCVFLFIKKIAQLAPHFIKRLK